MEFDEWMIFEYNAFYLWMCADHKFEPFNFEFKIENGRDAIVISFVASPRAKTYNRLNNSVHSWNECQYLTDFGLADIQSVTVFDKDAHDEFIQNISEKFSSVTVEIKCFLPEAYIPIELSSVTLKDCILGSAYIHRIKRYRQNVDYHLKYTNFNPCQEFKKTRQNKIKTSLDNYMISDLVAIVLLY